MGFGVKHVYFSILVYILQAHCYNWFMVFDVGCCGYCMHSGEIVSHVSDE